MFKVIIIDNQKIRYFETGKGKTIIFIPGAAASASVFIPALEIISKKFHCIALDLPGFGRSPEFKNKKHNYQNYTPILDQFLSQLNINSPYMVGISYGANMIIKFLNMSKNKPKKIILQSPIYKELPVNIRVKLSRRLFFQYQLISRAFVYLLKYKFVQKLFYFNYADFIDIPWERFDKYALSDLRHTSLRALKEALDCVFQDDLRNDAKKITIPTLIVYGSLETWIPEDYKLEISTLIKNCTFRILPNISHVFVLQNPELFAKTVIDFLEVT